MAGRFGCLNCMSRPNGSWTKMRWLGSQNSCTSGRSAIPANLAHWPEPCRPAHPQRRRWILFHSIALWGMSHPQGPRLSGLPLEKWTAETMLQRLPWQT